ncbi:MAG: 50S ribosomal protein L17 [Bacteroidetes bacterium]|nr:50S ribosomal protein L17 [Bacteroidota bacterium]
MRHRNSFNHLGRKKAHRDAMLSNMAASLILKKKITTTLAKAKALRTYIEPLITRSKVDSTHSRRVVFSYLQNKDAVGELFRDISVKVADRPGGYTRILKTGIRQGDNADMALIELVDFNVISKGEKEVKKAKSSRLRRGTKKKAGEGAKEEAGSAKETTAEKKVTGVPKTKKEAPKKTATQKVKAATKKDLGRRPISTGKTKKSGE